MSEAPRRALVPRLAVLLARRLGGAVVTVHLAGLAVLALAVAVEAAGLGPGELAGRLAERLPGLWSRIASALTLLGAALGAGRMRGDGTLLGLSSLGVSRARIVTAAALLGLAPGVMGAWVGPARPALQPPTWVRGEGGWLGADGQVVADVAGGAVTPRAPPDGASPVRVPVSAAAAGVGAAAGLAVGAVPVLVLASAWTVGEALLEPGGAR